jgi:hypothetical protein
MPGQGKPRRMTEDEGADFLRRYGENAESKVAWMFSVYSAMEFGEEEEDSWGDLQWQFMDNSAKLVPENVPASWNNPDRIIYQLLDKGE